MKVAIWALIIVGLYFAYEYTLGSIFREYQRCYEDTILELKEQTGSSATTCVTRKLVYENTNQCIASVQQQNNVSIFLYKASSVKDKLEREYFVHNEDCPANKISPPEDSAFYVPAGSNR